MACIPIIKKLRVVNIGLPKGEKEMNATETTNSNQMIPKIMGAALPGDPSRNTFAYSTYTCL